MERLFGKLMAKNFTSSSLRPQLAERLTIDEVVQIGRMAMNVICGCSLGKGAEFDNVGSDNKTFLWDW
jgi:hypothetical protein